MSRRRGSEPVHDGAWAGEYMRCPRGHASVHLLAIRRGDHRELVASCVAPGCGETQRVERSSLEEMS